MLNLHSKPKPAPAPGYFARQHGVVGNREVFACNMQKSKASFRIYSFFRSILVPCLLERFFVSAGFGLDAAGVKPFGIVPLGFVCAGAGIGADAVVFW